MLAPQVIHAYWSYSAGGVSLLSSSKGWVNQSESFHRG